LIRNDAQISYIALNVTEPQIYKIIAFLLLGDLSFAKQVSQAINVALILVEIVLAF